MTTPGRAEYRVEAPARGLRIVSLHGPKAKVSLDELRGELTKIRHDGWAMQDEELAHGLRSSPPVRGGDGSVVAGANVAVPARDWWSQRIVRELRPLVTAARDDISAIRGFAG
jgi:IclR family pca regulon transcriptional regulator